MVLLWVLAFWQETPVKIDETQALALMLKARYAMVSGDFDRALTMADEAMASETRAADAAFLKVEIMEERFQSQAAPIGKALSDLVSVLSAFIKLFPEDYRFPRLLGAMIARQPALAVSFRLEQPDFYLNKALALMENDPELSDDEIGDVWFSLGRWRLRKDRYFDAADAFRQVIERQPDSAWALYYGAQSHEKSYQLRKALRYYERFLEVSATAPIGVGSPVDLSVALIRYQVDPTEDHLEALRERLMEDAWEAGAVKVVVIKLEKMGYHEACRTLLNAVPVALRGRDHYALYAQVYHRSRDYAGFLERVETLEKEADDPEAHERLMLEAIRAAILAGRYEAVPQFAKSLKDVGVGLMSAMSAIAASSDISIWEDLQARFPRDSGLRFWTEQAASWGLKNAAWRLLLQVAMGQQDWDAALRILKSATDIDQPDEVFREDVAVVLSFSGEKEASFRLYEDLLAQNPDRIDLMNNYGYFLSLAGKNLDRAEQLLEKVLEAEPDNAAYLDTMAWIQYGKGNYEIAESWLRKALGEDGTDPEQLEHLGDVLFAMGREQEARKYWSQAMDGTRSRFMELWRKLEPAP